MPKKFAAALVLGTFLLSGCNAVKGLGRDIESVGEAGDRVTSNEVAAQSSSAVTR